MNLAFYRMLTKGNQDQPKAEPKRCDGKCDECSCPKQVKPSTDPTDAQP